MTPTDQIYSLDDTPVLPVTLLLGLQHVCIAAIAFVFPVLLVRFMGGSAAQTQFMVSMSMMAGGVGVILQALRPGPVGSGYLCPTVCGPSFLAASMLCVKSGGLSLVLGMTLVAGTAEALFSRLLNRIRVLFPPEITGVIVAMVGLSMIRVAGMNLMGMEGGDFDRDAAVAGLFTLLVMIGLNVWAGGRIKMFSILLGMAAGYAISISMGLLTLDQIRQGLDAPWVWFPFAHHPGWDFSWAMVLPVVVAMLCSSLKSIGDLTTCQKMNTPGWTRPDMENMKQGILADGLACCAAGLLGGMGQSTSSTNIGLAMATGAVSRVIAFAMGGIMIALAFFPKLSGIFAVMPAPVIGATLVFALSFMVTAGFQIVMSRMLDARKTFIIGLSIIFGLMVDVIPQAFEGFPDWIQPVFASSLSVSTVVAVVLNLIFRIGIRSTAELELECGPGASQAIFDFFEGQGRAWAARAEVIRKAASAVNEYAELFSRQNPGENLDVRVAFDELNLKVEIRHAGRGPELPQRAPIPEEMISDPGLLDELGGYLVRSYADRVKVRFREGRTVTRLGFEH